MTVAVLPMPSLIAGLRPGVPVFKPFGTPMVPTPSTKSEAVTTSFGNIGADQLFRQGTATAMGAVPLQPEQVRKRTYFPPIPPVSKLPGYHSLRFVFNNDPHEKFKALPHLVSAFSVLSRQAELTGRDVLRLNSGDNNVGKEPPEWVLNLQLMNKIDYHAVTAGNHEFDVGSEHYANGLEHAQFPTLLSNLKMLPGSAMDRMVRMGKIKTMPLIVGGKDGAQYAIIGLTTPELDKVVSKSAKRQGEKVLSFEETAAITKAQVDWLQKAGLNKIFVLSHMGNALDQKLMATVSGIDVIIGGHSHEAIRGIVPGYNYVKTPNGEPGLILQAGKNAEFVGVADVLFDPQGRVIPQQNVLLNTYSFPPDAQALAMRNAVLGTPQKVAEIKTAYDCNDNQYHADSVAQFTADAMRQDLGTDIAFVRSSEIRSNIEPGAFTDQDVKALMPFKDPIVKMQYSGEEILSALNRSAKALAQREAHPGMLHPSGLAVSMNKQTGQVQQAYVLNKATGQWEKLNPQRMYSVALGKFSVTNQEFPEFSHPERLNEAGYQPLPLQSYFEKGLKNAGAPFQPISFRDDGRLQIV